VKSLPCSHQKPLGTVKSVQVWSPQWHFITCLSVPNMEDHLLLTLSNVTHS
jgi:hypothetical protein